MQHTVPMWVGLRVSVLRCDGDGHDVIWVRDMALQHQLSRSRPLPFPRHALAGGGLRYTIKHSYSSLPVDGKCCCDVAGAGVGDRLAHGEV